jgi:hypothetical protein
MGFEAFRCASLLVCSITLILNLNMGIVDCSEDESQVVVTLYL